MFSAVVIGTEFGRANDNWLARKRVRLILSPFLKWSPVRLRQLEFDRGSRMTSQIATVLSRVMG